MKKAILAILSLAVVATIAWLAVRRTDEGGFEAVYQTGQYSRLASQVDADTPEGAWMKANCLRQLGRFEEALAVKQDSSRQQAIEELINSRLGRFEDTPLRRIRKLTEAEVATDDAHEAVAWGCIEQGMFSDAERIISAWQEQDGGEHFAAQRAYLRVMLERRTGKATTIEPLADLLSTYPGYELPPIAIAEILTTPPNIDFARAEALLKYLVTHFPENTRARLALASTLRKTGQLPASEQALEPLPETTSLAAELAREQAALEFDAGELALSLKHATATDSDPLSAVRRLSDEAFRYNLQGNGSAGEQVSRQAKLAATSLAMQGNHSAASEAFAYILDRVARTRRLIDVRARQMLFPEAQQLRDETNMLTSPAFAPDHPTLADLQGWFPPTSATGAELPGYALYEQQCAACHGTEGLGDGRASRHLKRGARNFQEEPIRIVSSGNSLASNEDLRRAISQGQVSGGMPAFAELTDKQLDELVEVVRHFQRQGLKQQFKARERNMQEPADKPEQDWVSERMLGDEPLAVPELATASSDLIEKGRAAFKAIGCIQCHSDRIQTYVPSQRLLHDSLGRPITAPNLVSAEFRGGDSATDIYRRIKLGIPGTPHPSARALDDETVASIVGYLQSQREAAPETPVR